MSLRTFFKSPKEGYSILVVVNALFLMLLTAMIALTLPFPLFLLLDPNPTNVLLGKLIIYTGSGVLVFVTVVVLRDIRSWMK